MADQISYLMYQRTLVSSCFEVFHKYFINISKVTLYPNFTILHLPLFFLSLFIISDITKKIAPVTEMDLNVLSSDYYANKSNFGPVPEFKELALRLMLTHNLTFPTNVRGARQLCVNLLSYISIIKNS